MSVLRVYRAQETGSISGKLRILRAQQTGTAVANTHLRVFRAQETGTAAVILHPFSPNALTMEPESTITLIAVMVDGTTADSYTWRRLPGSAPGTLTGAGAVTSVKTPSVMPQGNRTLIVGVTATKGGVTSPEQVITITVLPQLEWARPPGATAWAGATLVVPT